MSHLVRRAAKDTKATRSACERLLERKILSLPFWEEVPWKIEPMNGDGASMCMCTIEWKRVYTHACVYIGWGGGAPAIVSLAFRYITVTAHMFPLWQYYGSDRFCAIMLHKQRADALINHWSAEQRLLSFTLENHLSEKWNFITWFFKPINIFKKREFATKHKTGTGLDLSQCLFNQLSEHVCSFIQRSGFSF